MSYTFVYREHAEALYESLTEDAFYVTMERSAPDAREAMLRYLDYSMVEGKRYGGLVVAAKPEHGASVWSKPLAPDHEARKDEEKKRFLIDHMGESSLQTYNHIVISMSANAAAMIDESCWYLSIVGIAPAFQGQGLGAGLIEGVLETTDALGVSTYLETFTPRNMTFYERLGYGAAGAFDEPTTGASYWVMTREGPSSARY